MTDTDNRVPGESPNFRSELARELAELVPEAVSDGKIDVDALKRLIADDLEVNKERFGLTWPGKAAAMRAAQEPTSATLIPDREKSKNWDTTQNVFIEGDNLEVLKVLQRHYYNKIKLIYIDPPYNTGKDFIYPDNFREGLQTYLEWTKQVNEDGAKVSSNTESEGRFHSNWLNMMYPRLKLARNLLTDDGAIFISIGIDEAPNLRRLCDEIFGESNFITQIAWQNLDTVKNDAKFFSENHEYILVYARSRSHLVIQGLKRGEKQNSYYKNPDGDSRGPYLLTPLHAKSGTASGIYEYEFSNGQRWRPPAGTYPRFSKETLATLDSEGRIFLDPEGKKTPQRKTFLAEVGDRMPPITFWPYEDFGSTRQSNRELSRLMGNGMFPNPKPTKLLKVLLDTIDGAQDAIVLDFFCGSGTTAHAVMSLNAEDGGQRKFIQVQLPEPVDPGSEADYAGFRTIADLSMERIRRAGAELADGEASETPALVGVVDTGFRTYRLSDTNFEQWRVDSDIDRSRLEQHLFDLRESADDDAAPESLLTELMLKMGFSLSESIQVRDVEGLEIFDVSDGLLLACMNEHVKLSLSQLQSLVDLTPAKLVVLEDTFQGDDELKTNLKQMCAARHIELWTA